MDKFDEIFGTTNKIPEEVMEKVRKEIAEREQRKQNSDFIFRIPDWYGEGGMMEFWMNEDGSFEGKDTRISDMDIRHGLRIIGIEITKTKGSEQ